MGIEMIKTTLLLTLLILTSYASLFAQKQIAITFDDPNTYGSPIMEWEERNAKILSSLDKHKVKSALFVCGMRVNDFDGKTLLNSWDKRGHLMCNHSYSHLYYHSAKISINEYVVDFLKGDSMIRDYDNYTKLFRYPYLKEGNSTEKRDSMRVILKENGYRNGYVTVDASDWYIDSKITEQLKLNPEANLEAYKQYYINHIIDRIKYYDSLSLITFQRRIPHTLLLHHNLLNALFLDDLLIAIKDSGWELIDAEKTYNDEVFSLQYQILPCGESLVWQSAKNNESTASTLRYPAEDGEYENEKLHDFVSNFNTTIKKSNPSSLVLNHLTDSFYIFTTFRQVNGCQFPSNGMYLVTEDGVVLFDTPWDTTQFQPLLDSILARHNKKVVLALSTHYHDDRTAGLEFLRQKGVKTYSSKMTYDLCKQYNEKQSEFYFVNDTTFSIGSYKFETYYPGEGHTKDNIIIWFDQHKILYAGCLVKSTDNSNLGNVENANIKEWTPTLKKVMKRYPKPNFVIPGHFGWINNKGLKHTIKLLRF
jgi:glyoxylase-like metal-dependent hydrolase (beta-lactamase superfamily II)/peptidoglycan/xylan/chitin deacetylase (PgdA/CDA1 family)